VLAVFQHRLYIQQETVGVCIPDQHSSVDFRDPDFYGQSHHIMRKLLRYRQMLSGTIYHSCFDKDRFCIGRFQFLHPLIATVNLIAFMRTISAKLRRPLVLIVIVLLRRLSFSALQMTVLSGSGINIPIPVFDLPFLLLFAYAVLRGGLSGGSDGARQSI
jgi:hypothetical protein